MHIRVPAGDGEDLILHFPRTDAIQELSLLSEAIATLPSVMLDEQMPLLVRHAALQAFLLDVRAMVGFLSGPGPNARKDDQFARYLSEDWSSEDETEVANAMAGLVQQIHKQLAHVTTQRIGDGDKDFPVDVSYSDEELRSIADQMTAFYNRFAVGASMPQVGEYRPWQNADGTLATKADMEARYPGAEKRKHVRVTDMTFTGTAPPLSDEPLSGPAGE
ncbi:hypothetical protein K0817_017690 [Microbacterium sp. HD4P20]|uniref:hypothetical protein n=1 Tax=Microbacterium sp. HD4P20 TaxID=2864874 RepID=UPI001C63FFBE|nr:hypothetical protein [Microbacterium sp. HD4P20]MCP2638388.1 hypothetical protein [Microbacterium sp. HD4P20]